MNKDSKEWINKWNKDAYKPICEGFYVCGYGADSEPHSSIWMASLVSSIGPRFKNGLKILDYGCGAGRLCNFISKKLKTFSYFGLEKVGDFGKKSIVKARELLGKDGRGTFDFIGTETEDEAIISVDAVVLGSVFTHVSYSNFQIMCDRFLYVLDRGGCVVFSVFIENEYKEGIKNTYGLRNCFDGVWYTEEQIFSYGNIRSVKIIESDFFVTPSGMHHRIFRMEK